MNENTRLTRRDTWMARVWQMLIDLDEAISASPLEHLERRVVALEKRVLDSGDPLSEQKRSAEHLALVNADAGCEMGRAPDLKS